MKIVKLANVEDILNLDEDVGKIQIDQDVVMRYMYFNRDNIETKIDIMELRNAYAKSIKKSYSKNLYKENISISMKDIKKICCV